MTLITLTKNDVPYYLRKGGLYKNVIEDQVNDDEFTVDEQNFKPTPYTLNLNEWIWLFNTCNFWDVDIPLSKFSNNHKVEIFDYLVSLKDPSKTSPFIKKLLSTSILSESDIDYLMFDISIFDANLLLKRYPYFISYSIEEITEIAKGNYSLIKQEIFNPTGRHFSTIKKIEPFIPINDEEFTNLESVYFNKSKEEIVFTLPENFDQLQNEELQQELYNQNIESQNLYDKIFNSYLNLDDQDIRKIKPLFIFKTFNVNPVPNYIYIYNKIDLRKFAPFILYFYNYVIDSTDTKITTVSSSFIGTIPNELLDYNQTLNKILETTRHTTKLVYEESKPFFSIRTLIS